ncbi:carboxymuconolactone decarboxylase family protein [Streptacidiphilus rugosus]|uniref:carboxymuconolactone decarboxylase family protein n=1 Tax=Streptacidiphilus rugosus TaxID=405783 RepID=UPI00056790D9|nr:carboxymuconolactone decarboxylase family protein [Streptacidiphilus rugosus]
MTSDISTTDTPTADTPVVPPVRLDTGALAPHIDKAMAHLDNVSRKTTLEPVLLDLVRLRASQLNGCAYCVDTHATDLREAGQDERRVSGVAVWREMPFFTARERAALELTEAGTRLTEGPVTDEVFGRAADQFGETELAELIWTITVINAWNRLGAIARPWPVG